MINLTRIALCAISCMLVFKPYFFWRRRSSRVQHHNMLSQLTCIFYMFLVQWPWDRLLQKYPHLVHWCILACPLWLPFFPLTASLSFCRQVHMTTRGRYYVEWLTSPLLSFWSNENSLYNYATCDITQVSTTRWQKLWTTSNFAPNHTTPSSLPDSQHVCKLTSPKSTARRKREKHEINGFQSAPWTWT